jgi:HSP20 family protein
VLTIASEKEEQKEEKEDNYTRREFSYTSFSRSFTLPENVKEEDVKANYENGILKLSVPKKTITQPKLKKAIEVK